MFNSTQYNSIPLNSETEMFDIPARIITVLDKGFKKARALSNYVKTYAKIRSIPRSNTKLK